MTGVVSRSESTAQLAAAAGPPNHEKTGSSNPSGTAAVGHDPRQENERAQAGDRREQEPERRDGAGENGGSHS